MSANPLGQYKRIPGLSDEYRTPRAGKIYLGKKVANSGKDPAKCECAGQGCFKCSHPTETEHFVVPPEVAAVYTETPTVLDVVLPAENQEDVFPQAYAYYGASSGLKCKGNGVQAHELQADGKTWMQRECPCDKLGKKNGCSLRASLMVVLPRVSLGGVYQIDTGSIISIRDINSSIKYVRAMIQKLTGREALAWIPLKLRRVPTEVKHEGKMQKHYTLQILLTASLPQIEAIRERPLIEMHVEAEEARPDLRGPVYAGDEVVDVETGEVLSEGDQPTPETKPEPTRTPMTETTINYLKTLAQTNPAAKVKILAALDLGNYAKVSDMSEEEGLALIDACQPPPEQAPQEAPEAPKDEPKPPETPKAVIKPEGITTADYNLILAHYKRGGGCQEMIDSALSGCGIKSNDPAELTKEQGEKLLVMLVRTYGPLGSEKAA